MRNRASRNRVVFIGITVIDPAGPRTLRSPCTGRAFALLSLINRNRWFYALSAAALGLAAVWLTAILRRPVWDETLYHLPELARYRTGLPVSELLRGSGSAVGPLFYAFLVLLGAPFGDNLLVLRLSVLAAAAGCLLLFGRIAGRAGGPAAPAARVLLLVSFPYFLVLSGLVMSELPALLAGLAGFLLYLRWREKPGTGRLAGCLACCAAAVLVRQHFVFLPVGLGFHAFVDRGQNRRWRGLWFLLPVLTLLPQSLAWGGLVPPALQHRHAPGLSAAGIASFLAWTGWWCLPWLFLRVRRTRPGAWLLPALAAMPVAAAAREPGAGVLRGLLAALPPGAGPVLTAVAAALGGAVVIVLARGLREADLPARTATVLFFTLGLLLAFGGPLVYERYWLAGFALALIAFGPDVRDLPALLWSLVVQLPLAVIQLAGLAAK